MFMVLLGLLRSDFPLTEYQVVFVAMEVDAITAAAMTFALHFRTGTFFFVTTSHFLPSLSLASL